MEIAQVFLREEAVFVLLQLLHQIDKLFIVNAQLPHLAAYLVDAGEVDLLLVRQNTILKGVQLLFPPLHQLHVPGNDLFKKVI